MVYNRINELKQFGVQENLPPLPSTEAMFDHRQILQGTLQSFTANFAIQMKGKHGNRVLKTQRKAFAPKGLPCTMTSAMKIQ